MAKNQDGFEPGQFVTWQELVETKAKRRDAVEVPAITREDVASMKASEIRNLAAAHGLATEGVKLADLRQQVEAAIFVNL